MADLSDATVEELYGELESRFDACIFAARGPQKSKDSSFSFLRWHPEIIEVRGLPRFADHVLHRRYTDTYEDVDESDTPIMGG